MVKVLLIDDLVEFYELLKNAVEKHVGTEIKLEWVNGPDALEINEDNSYDIYLVDNKFNGIDKGLEIVNYIKESDPRSKIYVVSGHGDYDLLKNLFKQKVDGYVDKNDQDFTDIFAVIKIVNELKEINVVLSKKLKQIGGA